MAAKSNDRGSAADREIVTTRVLNASRDLVWQAWTEAKQLGQWWGPDGFTTTTSAFDFRAGGQWRFVMHGPDGRDYENRIKYVEIDKPERIVFEHDDGSDVPANRFHTTVMFVESGGKTTVTMRAIFPTAAERDRVVKDHGAIEGGKQTLARLDAYVGAQVQSPASSEFAISRVFDAPRGAVWKAWTDAGSLAHWWGPKGSKISVLSFDFRPGGIFHYKMQYSTGAAMWGRFTYREIVAPERIVWINSFSNADAEVVRGPFSPLLPLEMLNRMTLTESNGKTILALRSVPHGATAEECEFFRNMFGSMEQGFGGTFEQLAAFLNSA
jgi:uncharacterized protein YndB with AHSA1/START domain